MKRFILSACSVVIATAAIAAEAQALPKVDSAFNLQTLRLSELDTRNKSDEPSKPYYSQPSTDNASWSTPIEQENTHTTESAEWENAEQQEQSASPAISLIERRHQSLERN